ncbi:MAG: MFS transporter, partial [Chloroflexota bacterium]
IGFSCAPLYPTMVAETRKSVGLRHRANAIGFQLTASGIGSSLIPGALAWLAQHTSISIIGAFPLIGMIISLAIYEGGVRYQRRVAVTAAV